MPINLDRVEQIDAGVYSTPTLNLDETDEQEYSPSTTYDRDFVKSPSVVRGEQISKAYQEGLPNYETYEPLINEQFSGIAPGTVQTFLDNATPEDRAKFIQAINFDQDFGESTRRYGPPEEEGLRTGQEFDMLMAPLGKMFTIKYGPMIKETWDLAGLPTEVARALKKGDKETLKRMLMEARQAKGLGVGDLIYETPDKSKIDLTDLSTNRMEQRAAFDKFKGVPESAFVPTRALLADNVVPGSTQEYMLNAVKNRYRSLKRPADAAYKIAKTGAGTERVYDTSVLNRNLRDYMLSEGAQEAEVNTVLKLLQPSGRALTREQKDALKKIAKLEKEYETKKKALDMGAGARAGSLQRRLTGIENELAGLRKITDIPEQYLSEQELLNIVPQLNEKLRSSNMAFANTPNADRILRGVKNKYMQGAEDLLQLHGSERIQKLRDADALARKTYAYLEKLPEIEMLAKDRGLPGEIATNLLNSPQRLRTLIEETGDPELGKRLAEEMLSRSARPVTQRIPGVNPRLDLTKTSNQIESLFNDKEKLNFLKENLPEDRFKQLEAFRNISSRLSPVLDQLEDVPSFWEYMKQSEGTMDSLGRALGSVIDLAGYVKNRAIGGIPGFKWTDSRIRATNNVVDKVIEIANRKLNKDKSMSFKEIADSLSEQEIEALDEAAKTINNWNSVLGKELGGKQ